MHQNSDRGDRFGGYRIDCVSIKAYIFVGKFVISYINVGYSPCYETWTFLSLYKVNK
jgi:hypothetical protein